ncbi:Aspartic peptidase domain containing protein [Rhypophila sp. PSN 637]
MYSNSGSFVFGRVFVFATLVAATVLENPPPGIIYTRPEPLSNIKGSTRSRAWSKSSWIRPTGNVQKIQGVGGSKTNSRSVAALLGAHQRQAGGFGYENITSTNSYGTQYATRVLWDGFPMDLIIDTGSADTWAIQKDFYCVDYAGGVVPQSACAFGPANPNPTSSYGPVTPEQHMFVQYADGELVVGPMGYTDITVGNVTVKMQQTCLANTTYWYGNNVTSGLMGLAYSSLTNAYLGPATESVHDDPDNYQPYSPLMTSMINQGKIGAPVFSMAIDRNASTGMLAWGGMPPATGLDMSQTATLDIIITRLADRMATASRYSFYTVIPDGWQFGHTTNTERYPYIVDSGTTLCYLPPDLADAVAASYYPKAVYLFEYGAYFTNCDAIVPIVLAVILDGIKFFINPLDLIYRDMIDPVTGLCMIAISSGGSGPYILGDVFLQNALAIFDHGEAKMRFIPRTVS